MDYAKMSRAATKAALVIVVLAAALIANCASADSHSGGWQRDEIRLCEMLAVQGALANPDLSAWFAAEHAKRECKKLREVE